MVCFFWKPLITSKPPGTAHRTNRNICRRAGSDRTAGEDRRLASFTLQSGEICYQSDMVLAQQDGWLWRPRPFITFSLSANTIGCFRGAPLWRYIDDFRVRDPVRSGFVGADSLLLKHPQGPLLPGSLDLRLNELSDWFSLAKKLQLVDPFSFAWWQETSCSFFFWCLEMLDLSPETYFMTWLVFLSSQDIADSQISRRRR